MRRRSFTAAFCFFSVGVACFLPTSTAQEEGVTQLLQELFIGESVYPQEQGELQLTMGFLSAQRGPDDFATPVLFEYGITDRFQIEAVFPIEYLQTESPTIAGLSNSAVGAYWNFLNRPETGWAAGVGLELGLPTATRGIGENALIYEPFAVVYRELDYFAVNLSAGIEIADSLEGDGTETAGELAIALIRTSPHLPMTFTLEAGVEIELDETVVLVAPGFYWQPPGANWELGAALPIGLADAESDLGVIVQFTIEFGGADDDDGEDLDDDGA